MENTSVCLSLAAELILHVFIDRIIIELCASLLMQHNLFNKTVIRGNIHVFHCEGKGHLKVTIVPFFHKKMSRRNFVQYFFQKHLH